MRTLQTQAVILFGAVAFAWVLEAIDLLIFNESLDRLGIHPRDVTWLWGIAFAPVLHGGWLHLAANSLPFLALGWMVMLRRRTDFVIVTLVAIVVGGLGTWLFGAPNSIHIGASGVVFGFLGYLLARGYLERSLWAVLLAGIALVLFGSALWGVLPGQSGISWEGHLFGLLGGVVAARLLVRRKPRLSTA